MRYFLLFFLLIACASDDSYAPELRYVLQGTVQVRPGGPGLAGASLRFMHADGRSFEAQTDSAGDYDVVLPVGAFDAVVAAPGYASSHVQNLAIQARSRYDFVILPVFFENWSTDPIRLDVQGLPAETTLEQGLNFRARLESVLPPQTMDIAVGQTPLPSSNYRSRPQLSLRELADSGQRHFGAAALRGNYGDTRFEVVAYDQNNNRVHYLAPVHIRSADIDTLEPELLELPRPTAFQAVAYTASGSTKVLELQDNNPQPDPTLLVQARWFSYPWPEALQAREDIAYGFRVYRLEQPDDPEPRFLGFVAPDAQGINDLGPGLQPGKRVYYRVVPFIASHDGPSSLVHTTPLEPFQVTLQSPRGAITDAEPTLRWTAEPEVGTRRFFLADVFDTVTGQDIFRVGNMVGETSVAWNRAPLVPGRRYHWGLRLAYAVDDPNQPRAYSVAIDSTASVMLAYLPDDVVAFEVLP